MSVDEQTISHSALHELNQQQGDRLPEGNWEGGSAGENEDQLPRSLASDSAILVWAML
jgi:hypothetical protein